MSGKFTVTGLRLCTMLRQARCGPSEAGRNGRSDGRPGCGSISSARSPPRLRTLGALLTFAAMANVFALNVAYDVEVKLFSLDRVVEAFSLVNKPRTVQGNLKIHARGYFRTLQNHAYPCRA